MRRLILYIMLISLAFLASKVNARVVRNRHTIGPSEIISRVIEAAPDTLIARENLGEVEAQVMGSKSVFDTYLSADANYIRDEFARSSAFFGTRQDTANWDIGLTKKFPTGTIAEFDWTNQREQLFGVPIIQGQTVFPTVPTYESIVNFSVSQPLMKNFAGINDRSDVAAAVKQFESADLQTKYRTANIARDALSYYWRWVIAHSNMAVWSRGVNYSTIFLNTTLERRRLGTVEDTDVLAAKANLIGKRNGLIRARRQSTLMEAYLKVILGYPEEKAYSPKDRYPRYLRKFYSNKDEAIQGALQNRWDYLAQQERVERQNIKVVSAKNKRWPEFDLVGTLAVNNLTNSYSRTLGGVNNPYYMIGANFSIPLENRAARAEYKTARHQKAKEVIQLKKLENEISNTIAELYRRIEMNRQIVENGKRQVQMQREKLFQEFDKYRIGRSSSELLIIYQNDLLTAEFNLLDAWDDYLLSILDLKLADNTLVDL